MMADHGAVIRWQRHGQNFTDGRYSREHVWEFDGGAVIPASSSSSVVPLPFSVPEAVDPEEAFIAAVSSCHMLWFLSIAAGKDFVIDSYEDHAHGALGRNSAGKRAITEITLRPVVTFAGQNIPQPDQIAHMHHLAHEECFIANSVTTRITCIPG